MVADGNPAHDDLDAMERPSGSGSRAKRSPAEKKPTAREKEPKSAAGGSQTLERGLRVLALLAEHPNGLTVSAISHEMGTHRAGVYRMLRPLEAAQLIERRGNGSYTLGLGLVSLAANVHSRLQEVAAHELQVLADTLQATCALTIRQGEEAVAAIVQEPTRSHMHIAYSRGLRHSVNTSAAGLAILSGHPPRPGERPEVTRAREIGYAFTQGELFAGVSGVAVPIYEVENRASASISAVWLGDALTEQGVAEALLRSAQRINATLREETDMGLISPTALR